MTDWQKFQEGFIGNELLDYAALGIAFALFATAAWLTWKENK